MNHGLISKYSSSGPRGKSVCTLCPHMCSMDNDEQGKCMVRRGSTRGVEFHGYGKITSINVEPIEKKPLYHYKPGMKTLSVGGYGCSMDCSFCANYMISQRDKAASSKSVSPEQLIDMAVERNCGGICFTYNEPTVYFEYVIDVCILAKEAGLDTVLKTNAYLEQKPWEEICGYVDALNIDFKGGKDRYRKVANAEYSIVLDRLQEAMVFDNHVEISIPIYHDSSPDEYEDLLCLLSGYHYIPCHLLKVYPMNRHVHLTSEKTIQDIAYLFYENLLIYVYRHGIGKNMDTTCHICRRVSIKREGMKVDTSDMCGCFCGVLQEDIGVTV